MTAVPFNCPRCYTVTWRRADVHVVRCRYCDHIWTPPREL